MVTVNDLINQGKTLVISFKKGTQHKDHIKKFNNPKHYENYCNKMENGGWKEIGTHEHKTTNMKTKDILLARKTELDYTNDQREALLLIQKFIEDKSAEFFLLVGSAGTGKTTIAENIARFSNSKMLAPTNAAVKRLHDKIGGDGIDKDRFGTLHQTLYGAPDIETGEFIPKEGLKRNGVYIIDEASMIDKKVLDDLLSAAQGMNCKLIFTGDNFQLEPIGKDPLLFLWNNQNKSFEKKWTYKLNKVRRNEGNILKVATHLRSCTAPEIINCDTADFQIVKQFSSELPLHIRDDEDYIVLCSTNKKRMFYNKHIRRARFAEESKSPIVNYERLIAVANTRFLNGESFTIINPKIIEKITDEINIGSRVSPEYREFDFFLVQHEVVGQKGLFKTLVIPYLDKPSVHPMMLMTSNRINHNPRLTEFFNESKFQRQWRNDIAIATYGYAISCHRAQGNEWDHVYIDCDWLSDAWNHNRWLYTAITRARKTIEITNSKYFKTIDP